MCLCFFILHFLRYLKISGIFLCFTSLLNENQTHSLICGFQIHPAIWKIWGSRGEEREKTIEEATEHLKTLENELKGKKFFGGDEIGLVDIAGNFVALWLGVILDLVGIKLLTKEKFPRLSEWTDDFLSNSVIKETLPPREDLLAIFRSLFGQSN